MLSRLRLFVLGLIAAIAIPAIVEAKTFYWISHGGPA
ncbi:MAG: sugar ABC transporter substrate-binding protein, partial [Mesorhizobium sp.]